MKKEPKTIEHVSQNVLRRSGEGSAIKESERILSTSERIALAERREKGLEIQKNHLDVWFVENEFHRKEDDAWKDRLTEEKGRLAGFEEKHNRHVAAEGENADSRELRMRFMLYNDMAKGLHETYGNLDRIQEIPEIIVMCSGDAERPENWVNVPDRVTKAADKTISEIFRYQDEIIPNYLAQHLYVPTATKFDFKKQQLSEDVLIEYGLQFVELMESEKQQQLFSQYIFEKNPKHIEKFFSDDVLKKIYEDMCTVPTENIDGFMWEYEGSDDVTSDFYHEFKVDVDHEKNRREFEPYDEDDQYDENYSEVQAAVENYWNYRQSITDAVKKLPFDAIKERMRSYYIGRVRETLDGFAEEFISENDAFEAEKQLLKSVLVHVSSDSVSREVMRYQGADIVLPELSTEEMAKLIEFTSRMKGSASSIMAEKLKRNKAEFYKSVEDKLDARSEITADTEKEIEILEDIFAKHGAIKDVLDVGCGNGRIGIPLLERGYAVTGIDANENFLQEVLKKAFEKGLSKGTFRKGDVISYRSEVMHGLRDAVIYTWHTILEAFGPGNLMHTLGDAYYALKPGGVLVFDQPTRNNPHMEDGWYGNDPDNDHHYLSYIMTEDEIRFVLKMAGFENVELRKWKTKPSDEYPEGMEKFTVSARKPHMDEDVFEKMSKYLRFREENEVYNKRVLKQWYGSA